MFDVLLCQIATSLNSKIESYISRFKSNIWCNGESWKIKDAYTSAEGYVKLSIKNIKNISKKMIARFANVSFMVLNSTSLGFSFISVLFTIKITFYSMSSCVAKTQDKLMSF